MGACSPGSPGRSPCVLSFWQLPQCGSCMNHIQLFIRRPFPQILETGCMLRKEGVTHLQDLITQTGIYDVVGGLCENNAPCHEKQRLALLCRIDSPSPGKFRFSAKVPLAGLTSSGFQDQPVSRAHLCGSCFRFLGRTKCNAARTVALRQQLRSFCRTFFRVKGVTSRISLVPFWYSFVY